MIDGASVYGYALQNPGRWVDPRGEFGVVGALLGGGSNLVFQVGVNILRGQSIATAFNCVNWSTVAASAAFGAIGASPFSVLRSAGVHKALGVTVVTTYTKQIEVPPAVAGSTCDCEKGNFRTGPAARFLDFFASMQF